MKKIEVVKQINLNLNITIAFLIFLAAAILVLLFFYYPIQRNILVFIASLAGGGGAIYSAYYVGKSIKDSIERDTLHRSFEVMKFLTAIEMMRLRSFLNKEIKDDIAIKDLYKAITDNDQIEHAVKTTLNHLEMISLQIQTGYIDENIAMLHLYAVVDFIYIKLEAYVTELRNMRNDKLIYTEFEKLALAWKSRKSVLSYPRTKIF